MYLAPWRINSSKGTSFHRTLPTKKPRGLMENGRMWWYTFTTGILGQHGDIFALKILKSSGRDNKKEDNNMNHSVNPGMTFKTMKISFLKIFRIKDQTYTAEKRREFKTKRWYTWLLLAIVFYFAILPVGYSSAQPQPEPTTPESFKYGYYYTGQFIPLTPSEELMVASETGVTETGATFSTFARAQSLERDPLSDIDQLKDRKLGLYRVKAPTSKTERRMDLRQQLEHFAPTVGEEIQPVFEQGQALLIPHNEIIVGFKEALTLSQARSYFDRYRDTQGIVEVKEHRKNTYILRIGNPSNGRVYQVCQFLAKQNEIDFAEPNHIVVLLREPLVPMLPGGNSAIEFQGGEGGGNPTPTRNSPVTWTVLVNESFEGTAIPSGWSTGRMGNTNADAFWSVTNYRSHAGSQSIYATGGGAQGVPAPGDYPNNSFSWLDTPTLNLASYEEVYIELWFYARYEATAPASCTVPDRGVVGIYNPVSDTTAYMSALAVCYTGDLTSDPTTDRGWRRALVRVPPALRQDGVRVRFVFRSDSSRTQEGLYIDQVRIVGTADVDTEPLGNDTYSARLYEMKNAGQIAGLGGDSNDMNVPEAWDLVSVSPDVVVAVVDSGVDLTHPDLNLVAGYDPDGTTGGGPRGSHGTACAGNVGAKRNNSLGVIGTAPGVKIIPVYMGGNYTEIANAIDVAVAHDADVLSNSWGWVGAPSADIAGAINDALNAGRVVLFAAGNGPDRAPWTYDVAFPGNLTGSTDVICVGASSPTDEHKAAASSDGSFAWGSSYVGDGPDIVAPSPWSYTTDIQGAGGYHDGSLLNPSDANRADYTPTFGGTSSATPKVAGVVALILSANPDLKPAQVKKILRETADDIDLPGVDDKTGAGRVNAEKAVKEALKDVDVTSSVVFQYAVKFVCGKSDGTVVAPGKYFTAINVHNPTDTGIVLTKKFAIALPGEKPGPVSQFFKTKLGPDEAFEIDNRDIFEHTDTRADFLKGFVVIKSKVELDVVAVYTAAGATGQVETLHVEYVSPRRPGTTGCPDLIVEHIDKPVWDQANRRSVISATIKNIGDAPAGPTIARVIDPTTLQPTGAPYNATANTPALAPGASTSVTFYLPYWVYNPDVTLEVTADYKNQLSECNEDNNMKVFEGIG